ncbi:MAG TPA: hypothetical protein VL086_04355 [Candidatus Nitrosotalea sp.]|nr:hypothetical protein [Candidatus Nitrosotalea sp.]
MWPKMRALSPASALQLERWSYLVLLAAGLPLVLIGCPRILGEFGFIDANAVGVLDMIFSIMLILPTLAIWSMILMFGVVAFVMGRARLRRRLLLIYICVGLLLWLATDLSIPGRTAAVAGAVGLSFLLAGPTVWLAASYRQTRAQTGGQHQVG